MVKKLNRYKVRKILPRRKPDMHKGDAGRILLLCGSVGYTGAAALAAKGALRSGSGLVYLGVPESIYQIEATKLDEAVVFPLPNKNGMLSEKAIEQIDGYLPRMDAVLLGPGLGIGAGTEAVVKYVMTKYEGTVVLDADGISLLSGHKNVLRDRKGTTILTPHEGEFTRFTGTQITHRQICAQALAADLGCVVLLKGNKTIITDGNDVYVNPTGNPGMAVGGCGDVLSGIIASLVGQGVAPLEAAACGAWLHGAAGDICAKKLGSYGMLPADMLLTLPRLMG